MEPNSLRDFVDRLVNEQYGTSGAIAKAIGMSLSAFSRGVRYEGTLGVDKLLKLAESSGNSPDLILTLGKKPDVARLIGRLYGPPRAPLSGADREFLNLWRSTPAGIREAMLTLLRVSAKQENSKRRRSR